MSWEDCSQEQSQKQNLEMQRKRRKQRFFSDVTVALHFRAPLESAAGSAINPLKTSVTSASSAFQGFVFGFWHIATWYNFASTLFIQES